MLATTLVLNSDFIYQVYHFRVCSRLDDSHQSSLHDFQQADIRLKTGYSLFFVVEPFQSDQAYTPAAQIFLPSESIA